jgi:hypothetical protein
LYIFGNLGSRSGSSRGSNLSSTNYQVTYEIGGTTNRASITYENEQGNIEQMDINVPWKKSMTVSYGQFLYISAQNDLESGSITCKIIVDGKEFKSAVSSGAYVIASCSGSAGRE